MLLNYKAADEKVVCGLRFFHSYHKNVCILQYFVVYAILIKMTFSMFYALHFIDGICEEL